MKALADDKDKYIREAVKNTPSAIGIITKKEPKPKKFDLDDAAQKLFEAFNSDGGLIIDTDVKKITILMLRSGSRSDNHYTLSIEKTRDHETFETISSHFISLDDHEEAIDEFKMAIELYLLSGGSKSSLVVY